MVTPKTEGWSLLLADWDYDRDRQAFTKIVCELPGPGITTRMLRELRTGELLAALRAAQRQVSALAPEVPPNLAVSSRACAARPTGTTRSGLLPIPKR